VTAVVGSLGLAAIAAGQPVATIITHGYSLENDKGPWIEAMADAIVARAGAGAVMRYRQDTGAWALVSGVPAEDEPLCLIFRWLEDFEKSGPDWGFAEAAADAMYAALRDPVFVDAAGAPLALRGGLVDRTLHFIGHSRGTCVNSEVTERLGVAGIAVDQVTTLDPHPVNGTLDPPLDYDWGDPVPQRWSNVTWADNIWRADGGGFNAFDFDGMPLPATLDVELDEAALECCAYGFSHSDVHLWYHGTTDLAPNPCDGSECIDDVMRGLWWPEGYTERGYYYSALGGGQADRPAIDPGIAPGPVPSVYGGSFDQAGFAGWLYHGGSVDGQVLDADGRTHLRLGAGTGLTAVHNRQHVPQDTRAVAFVYRIFTPDGAGADDRLEISILDADGTAWPVGGLDLFPAVTGWEAGYALQVPLDVPRGVTGRLLVEVSGGAGVAAVVGLDDIALVTGIPGDLDGDGSVGTADLLALLAAWGLCPTPPEPCPADLDADGSVGTADLLMLLAFWG
jgi:hypothetical protein